MDGNRYDVGTPITTACATPPASSWCYSEPLPPRNPGYHTLEVTAYNDAGETASTTVQFVDSVVFVRLWTKVGGTWRYVDSTFTPTKATADFIYPAFGATDFDVARPLSWTAVSGATAYSLNVTRAVTGETLVEVSDLHDTSYLASTLTTLDADTRLVAKLGVNVNGTWRYTETPFSVQGLAKLTFPADGAIGVGTPSWFSWKAAPAAQNYRLDIGTAPGTSNVLESDVIHKTSYVVTSLPAGVTLYVRLWTQRAGAWYGIDSRFVSAP
jgi:hypothetical protein